MCVLGRVFDQQKANQVVRQSEEAVAQLSLQQTRMAATFAEVDRHQLSEYQFERVRMLLEEWKMIRQVPVHTARENIHDYMRLVRCCQRKTAWIQELLVELNSIIGTESNLY